MVKRLGAEFRKRGMHGHLAAAAPVLARAPARSRPAGAPRSSRPALGGDGRRVVQAAPAPALRARLPGAAARLAVPVLPVGRRSGDGGRHRADLSGGAEGRLPRPAAPPGSSSSRPRGWAGARTPRGGSCPRFAAGGAHERADVHDRAGARGGAAGSGPSLPRVPAGAGPQRRAVRPGGGRRRIPSSRTRRMRIYVVLRGRCRFRAGAEEREVEPGAVLFVPGRMEHRFVDLRERLEALVFFGPAEGSRS